MTVVWIIGLTAAFLGGLGLGWILASGGADSHYNEWN
jgi:hypothetical protein